MLLKDIKPYPQNAKKHTAKQVQQIANSIKEFGFAQPIVIDKSNTIIVGHGRYHAAQKLGLIEVPIIQLDLTPEQTAAYRLADNKLNESEWDMKLVIEELKSLSLPMLELTGFSKDLIIESSELDDIIPEDVPTKAKLGDLFELGPHRVLCGDSTQKEVFLRLMGDKKADMVFTDPPYNVDYTGKTAKKLKIENDIQGNEQFYDFLLEAFNRLAENIKLGGVAYITHADSEGLNFRKAFIDSGFLLKQCIIWNKNSMVMGRQDYHWKHEPILYGWLEGGSHTWTGDRTQTTVWDIPRPSRSESHPTMKPVDLIIKALHNNTKEEDLILDSFLGSGSTLIASEKSKRICYGVELDPKYVDVIVQRYVDFVPTPVVKLNGKEIEWPKISK